MVKTAVASVPSTRLVLVRKTKPFNDDELEEVVYELTWGDYVQVQSSGSANPIWHPRDEYDKSEYLQSGCANGENIIKTGTIVATIDGGLIGFYEAYSDFERHIEYYMRGEILEILDFD